MEGKKEPRRPDHGMAKAGLLHQIWLGNEKLPPGWMRSCKEMAEAAGWKQMVWDDKKVEEELGTDWRTYWQYKKRNDFIGRADIVRYEIMWRYGGI